MKTCLTLIGPEVGHHGHESIDALQELQHYILDFARDFLLQAGPNRSVMLGSPSLRYNVLTSLPHEERTSDHFEHSDTRRPEELSTDW